MHAQNSGNWGESNRAPHLSCSTTNRLLIFMYLYVYRDAAAKKSGCKGSRDK